MIICGLATDICVQLTAIDAFLREYRVWVPADCNAAESLAAKETSLAYMAGILKCDTTPALGAPKRARRARPKQAA